MKDLKHKVIRGGFAKALAQGTNFLLRTGSMVVLARLLAPRDFGLVGMVTAFTGVLNLFRDFGLSTATVQRGQITDDQVSTLFWINILVGVGLALILAGMAPFVAVFYHEPRLVWVSVILATSFIFNAAGVQQTALLERQMRFTVLAAIDVISLLVSTAIGVAMAASDFGYWALVAVAVTLPLVTTVGLWLASAWTPGRPRSWDGLHSLLRFGGGMTLANIIVYMDYNLEKVLLGRFWGAEALGLYGRAYQLVNLPTENINSAFWGVAFSGLSRVRDDPERFKNYFLKGYSLVLALTIPTTIAIALFAPDLILVLLGPKWIGVIPIFRLLAPTILIFALIDPLAWLTYSLGLVGRNLKMMLATAPLVIGGYVIGLPYGPKGVAFGFSLAMTLWAVPRVAWSVRGTVVSVRDVFVTASKPFCSGIVAAAVTFAGQVFFGQSLPPFGRLILGITIFSITHVLILLYVLRQHWIYSSLLQGLRKSSTIENNVLASV